MSKLYLMTGPCGAGKSTLAKELSESRNLRLIEPERFYRAFFGDYTTHIHQDEVWEAIAFAIKVAMDDNIDVLVDTNSPSRADRDWFIKRFPRFEFNLIVVEADKELCLLNNRSRDRQIPEDAMVKMFERMEPISEDEMNQYESVELYRNTDNTGVKFVEKLR